MTWLLVRLFIKNSDNIKDSFVRSRYGILSGVTGILCNLVLFAAKFFAGILTGSVAISADAFNNLSDAGSAIVTLLGFKMSEKPADDEHPFGHGRIEYLAGLLVAAAIIYMGIELFRSSVSKIIHPEAMEFSWISVIILVLSILIKCWLHLFNKTLGKRIDSTVMLATSIDSLSDCIATSAVLLSLLFSTLSGINIDGYAGAIVAVFVAISGVKTAKETLSPLLGRPADPAFVNSIYAIVEQYPEIIGTHDLVVHDYGPGRVFVSLHAEIPYNMELMAAHDIIDNLEAEIGHNLHCGISIHMDPIVTDDAEINDMKQLVKDILASIDPIISMHDFRVAKGITHSNLIFDIVVPFSFAISDSELSTLIKDKVSALHPDYFTVLQIDHSFISAEKENAHNGQ